MHAHKVGIASALAIAMIGQVTCRPVAAETTNPRDLTELRNANCALRTSSLDLLYDPLAQQPTERLALVTVRCQARGPLHLTVEAGPGTSGSIASRTMSSTSSTARLVYTLYIDGQPFGDGSNGTRQYVRDFASTSGVVEAAFTVRLVAAAGQDVPIGSYNDNVSLVARY